MDLARHDERRGHGGLQSQVNQEVGNLWGFMHLLGGGGGRGYPMITVPNRNTFSTLMTEIVLQ